MNQNIHEYHKPRIDHDRHPFTKIPNELLHEIVYWATYNPVRVPETSGLLKTASLSHLFDAHLDEQCDRALSTKYALSFVSRRFEQATEQFFYEDIRVRYGAEHLLSRLEASQGYDTQGVGFKTQRVCLYGNRDDIGAENGYVDSYSFRVLSCCPNIKILQKKIMDANLPARSPLACVYSLGPVHLPFLRRLDWHNSVPLDCTDNPHHVFVLPDLIRNTPNVDIISANMFPELLPSVNPREEVAQELALPNVHTVRLRVGPKYGAPHLPTLQIALPSLRRLIISDIGAVNCVFGGCISQHRLLITELELGSQCYAVNRIHYLAYLLDYFPHVRSLQIPLMSMPSTETMFEGDDNESTSLRHLLLYAPDVSTLNGDDLADMINQRLSVFCNNRLCFAQLERITLLGPEWMPFEERDNVMLNVETFVTDRGLKLAKDYNCDCLWRCM